MRVTRKLKKHAILAAAAAALFAAGCGGGSGVQARRNMPALQPEQVEPDAFDRGQTDVTAATHFAAGQFAETQGKLAEAEQQYAQAVDLDPRHEPALYRLGVLQTRRGDHAAARKTWNQYVTATDGSADAYGALGYCLELSGDPLGAETAYRKGVDADADHQGVRVNYGLLLARQGRDGEATEHLAIALPMPAVLYNIGVIHERDGDTAAAIDCYREALDLKPDFRQARQRLLALAAAEGVASVAE